MNENGTFVLQFPQEQSFIWTSYDVHTKRHWLSLYKDDQKTRFLLRDASTPNVNESTDADIHETVDMMVVAVEATD